LRSVARTDHHLTTGSIGRRRGCIANTLHSSPMETDASLAVDVHGHHSGLVTGLGWSFYPAPMTGLDGAVATARELRAFDGSGSGYIATSSWDTSTCIATHRPGDNGATFGCGSFVAAGQSRGRPTTSSRRRPVTTWTATAVPTDAVSEWICRLRRAIDCRRRQTETSRG